MAARAEVLTAGAEAPKKSVALHFAYADGLRALAVFYVVFFHLKIATPELGHHVRLADLVIAFDPVVMFFILSGFLLAGPFMKAYLSDTADFPLVSGFAMARVLRAFPVYYVGLIAISLFLWATHQPITLWDFISHAIFVSNFSPATAQTISGPLWTLGVDIQFYFALPLAAWLFYKNTRGLTRARKTSILYWALGLTCVACIVYRYFAQLIFNPVSWEEEIVIMHQLPGMACVVAAGIGARLFLETASADARRRLDAWAWGIMFAAICFRPLGWAYDTHLDQIRSLHVGSFGVGRIIWSLQDMVAAIAGIMFVLALAGSPRNPITRLLSSRFFTWLSLISFSLYVFHITVITAIVGEHPVPTWPLFFKGLLLSIAVLLPLCYAMYRFVESPFLKMKTNVRRSKGPHVIDYSDVQKAGATVVDARHFPGTTEQV